MHQATIFQPVIVMIVLTFAVALWMLRLRFKAVGTGALTPAYFKLNRGGKAPEHLTLVTHHFDNLLEIPPLFYIACVIAFVLNGVDGYMLGLAWAYVAARLVHCAIHTSYNNVFHRMFAFLASTAVLGVMWAEIGRLVFSAG